MYYLTQVLKRVSKNDHVMFLGFSDDLKVTYYLTEELKEITNIGEEYTSFKPYPYLFNAGFFNRIDVKKLLNVVDNAALKSFIKTGGIDTKAKDLLQNHLNTEEE